MDLEYDRKFEEMKKYIPFLESMITRLESTSLSSNPRQAQLDKIRSLRDLLLDKKKRMKMENLLKCEQVLVNLYAKVEQRESLSGVMKVKEDSVFSIDSPTPKEKSELEAVRNKLKTVAKIQEETQETLPEIARASEVQEVCTSGKEPALFQRRPNKSSISPIHQSPSNNVDDTMKSPVPSAKRNYTRVLVSPEPGSRRWSPPVKPEEKPLFSRRSPRRSPRRYSPSYHKRERKKTSRESNSRKSKGINITLNVPQESLNSLNTKDILPRIINCSDGDVDIDTLRELRKQILGELKKTGANDDISDLILKSYNKKSKSKKKEEVEEGELSDSESEAIENIYGSLVVKDQSTPGQSKNVLDKDNRKIQICLVINSDKEQSAGNETVDQNKNIDASDFEMYNKDEATEKVKKSEVITIDDDDEKTKITTSPNVKTNIDKNNTDEQTPLKKTMNETTMKQAADAISVKPIPGVPIETKLVSPEPVEKRIEISANSNDVQLHLQKEQDSVQPLQQEQNITIETHPKNNAQIVSNTDSRNILDQCDEAPSKEAVPFKANFYMPLIASDNTESDNNETKPSENLDITNNSQTENTITTTTPTDTIIPSIEDKLEQMESPIEIPLLNEPTIAQKPAKSIVSEIDILQALKNDILSESLSIPGSETTTPLLHQPKVNKVASVQEILPKKRISIEKYKQKSVKPVKTYSLSNESNNILSKDEQLKKSKIKLTEKECERFNIPKISFDEEDSSEDDDIVKDDFTVDDVYGDLAPKSPDQDESCNIELTPPVIIPSDPVKPVPINRSADVDMRSLPISSPTANIPSLFNKQILPPSSDALFDGVKNDNKNEQNYRPPLIDPRVRRDQRISIESPSPHTINPAFISSTPNILPNRTPIMTPNARSYEMTPSHMPPSHMPPSHMTPSHMTPSHQTFEVEQGNRKHVYAPSFTALESTDMEKSHPRESRPWENTDPDRRSRFDDAGDSNRKWDDRDPRSNSVQRDIPQKSRYSESFGYKPSRNDRYDKREERPYSRADCPLTPLPSFGRSDAPIPSTQTFSPVTHLPFVRGDCPTTPSHPFGRSDCPTTPSHPFGRTDCPLTPSHPFGRSECPSTPSHPFGRSECPTTPIHPFGRSDAPNKYAPSHNFGRSECPMTPSHPFGRSDIITNQQPFGRSELNSKFTKDPRLNRKSEYESNPQYGEKDRGYNRGSSYKPHPKQYGGSDSYRNYEREQSMSRGDKYQHYADKSGRQINRDQTRYEHSRSMSRDYEYDQHHREKGSRYENETSYEEVGSRRYQRERSVGRTERPDENYRSTSRAPSIGRTQPKTPDNKFSVKPDAGRSFTIDTSVNTTFQKLIESGKGIQVFDYSFDARRQRASSVGRSLVRESSVGRTLPQDFKPNYEHNNKREMFRRASTVGRELIASKNERSFQEIKADFETYRSSTRQLDLSKSNKFDMKAKNPSESTDRNRKNVSEKEDKPSQSSSISSYSPRKNPRDPRMAKKMNYKDPRTRREEKEKAAIEARRKGGIDYSSDNIAKGTILGSGCGVKNYKIPKIKRPVEEKPEEIEKEQEKLDKKEPDIDSKKDKVKGKKQEKLNETANDKTKEKEKEKMKEREQLKLKETDKVVQKQKLIEKPKSAGSEIKIDQVKHNAIVRVEDTLKVKDAMIDIVAESNDSKSDDNVERRITRSSTKGLGELKSPESSPIKVRTRRSKKNILCDSDSDSEKVSKSKNDNDKIRTSGTEKNLSPLKHKHSKNIDVVCSDVDLDSSFGIDELEMFHDNAVSDNVIDNINALIADLDNDIDTSRNDTGKNFTKEITLENMLESINSPENDSNSANADVPTVPESTNTAPKVQHGEVVEQISSQECIKKQFDNVPGTNIVVSKEIESTNTSCEKGVDAKQADYSTGDNNVGCIRKDPIGLDAFVRCYSDSPIRDMVSTTHTDPKAGLDQTKLNEHNMDRCSTPVKQLLSQESIRKQPNNVALKNIQTTDTSCEKDVEYSSKKDPVKLTDFMQLLSKSVIRDMVSTTHTDPKAGEDQSKLNENNTDSCSTPDSTINTDENVSEKIVKGDGAADSTHEDHNEANVSSTDFVEPKVVEEPSTSHEQTQPAVDPIGSLLSLLQDKSKIKEVLSMLSGQSIDNEKIKKKLEKISEIMSDDEGDRNNEEKRGQTEDKEQSLVPNIDESSVSNMGEEAALLEDSMDADTKSKAVHENVDQTSKKEENVDKEMSIEEDSKESHDITSQQDDSHENIEAEETDPEPDADEVIPKPKKRIMKKSKFARKGRGKQLKNLMTNVPKRVTRADAITPTIPKVKKPSRELLKLQEDIKEMFIRDDVLSSTGIRMCRIAKLVDDKNAATTENEPVVVLEKFKNIPEKKEDPPNPDKVKRKKPGPKPKVKLIDNLTEEADKPDISMTSLKLKDKLDTSLSFSKLKDKPHISLSTLKVKPGPKSKTRPMDRDPYAFETDSFETTTEKASDDDLDSDSESSSVTSSKSFGSTECLADIKKKTKRKRRGWQAGVIKPKHKKKKLEPKASDSIQNIEEEISRELVQIPDKNCFTDRTYCFRKNVSSYSCRLCSHAGNEIVHHYKRQHPHIEIPLSRMAPMTAKLAIEQCTEINFQAICKIPSEKYVCIFCYQEFAKKAKSVLETFFWHIVSTHTGEYKQSCTECVQDSQCPFTLDIPSPPKDAEGQLIGYICKKCNFTQISLENIKTHVIVRHNDEQTAVYTINLSVMSKKGLNKLLRQCNAPGPARVLRSCRSNQSLTEASDDCSDITESSSRFSEAESIEHKVREEKTLPESKLITIQSKITFETDENASEPLDENNEELGDVSIKAEQNELENADETIPSEELEVPSEADNAPPEQEVEEEESEQPNQASNDIVDYPHFKISFTDSGAKEYICCINRQDRHFKTPLLISMKKHVQMKHSENWDGYCYMCKVIVTPQGAHRFKDCLQHYLDKHMDSFPVLENEVVSPEPVNTKEDEPVSEPTEEEVENMAATKPYINVRPLCQLISKEAETNFPKIERVVSLGALTVEAPRPSPTYPTITINKPPIEKQFKYEEAQAQVMSNKHRVVLDTMMARVKLISIFKCAGRFCSFTTNSAEDALVHASTHQRIGGIDALNCSYCDFDSTGNAIDLVMHVFKAHGSCQYSCGQCFYRAAASQLVGAHMTRMHASMAHEAVLRTTTVTTPVTEGSMLTRTEAVQYYICTHEDENDKCKFRTYTPDKFSEHLQQRHPTATSHACYFCSVKEPTPNDLVAHLKSHGLKVYQCTWCVHGADNETELLAHVSAMHPSKQPQAYLRIITNKDGSNELRVLPLAFLNKSKILTEDVGTNGTNENPVREAERSIELEKLIGHANLVAEAASQSTETSPSNDEPPSTEVPEQVIDDIQTDDVRVPEIQPVTIEPPPHVTPPRTASPHDISLQKTPVLKTEPPDPPKELPDDIVVLDSDEEDSRPGVIDLSEDDAATSQKLGDQHKKIPANILHRCPKCQIVCKSIHGLKKHMMSCLPNLSSGGLTCPHCKFVFSDKFRLLNHYTMNHREGTRNECGECGANFVAMATAKKHAKTIHHATDFNITQRAENGIICFVVNVVKHQRVQPKRKLSSNAAEAPAAKRRYWSPQEIDQLPINPILDQLVYCSLCEFSTKVRLNMVRHLQMHGAQQPVPQTAPVNPVPHLETNEKHFDKMVNLASSSIVSRAPERPRPEPEPAAAPLIPPEAASRYPKFVPERQRLTCGAKGCSYISVDEQMLRIHWETLHSGTNDYHCVHCPPYQHLDTSKPLTSSRILAHLKMHDVTLYACSSCCYYHFKREALEKHLSEVHKGGKLMIVREEASSSSAPPAASQPNAAPTMDLKPWQCGLCKFKSMLRPAVIDHCAKFHQSKMQFKCAYCPFRTSAVENINKHQANSHPGRPEDVFYYYYREDSVADEPDGTPRWQKQRQKCGITESEIKTEPSPTPSPPAPTTAASVSVATTRSTSTTSTISVDLNLVKKEVDEVTPGMELDIEELCKKFGQFCDPNGLHFTCPLCKVVAEDNREAMQCHLYEELKYRRWGCGLCSYKAFHKNGLNDHISSEHRRQYTDPIKLPVDINMEKWVTAQLDHQMTIIDKNKVNLAKLKQAIVRNNPGPSTQKVPTLETVTHSEKYSMKELEAAFGPFGGPSDMQFCCSKCKFLTKDESAMKDHLESELTKIRWCCSLCTSTFQTYHEAQFHVKSHSEPARPREAVRDPALRAAWLAAAIQTQKQAIKAVSSPATTSTPEKYPPENDNSLLVVRYEESVTTPEDTMPVRRKRSAPSDAEGPSQKKAEKSCPYCDYKTRYNHCLMDHIPKHFNLKPYTCSYCDFSSYRQGVMNHIERQHPGFLARVKNTEIPPELIANFIKKSEEESKLICLFCEKSIPDTEVETHLHDNVKPEFAKKGDVVVKCCICLVLRIDVKSLQEHHNTSHPDIPINYALFKLHHDTRETNYCGYCNKGFKYIRDLKTHHIMVHSSFPLNYTSTPYTPQGSEEAVPTRKRCARKSTTKLPNLNSVAKKSTTKLPSYGDEGYSYYNTRPSLEEFANVTTLVPICNTMMPFTFKKLKEFLKVDPKVLVKDIQSERKDSSDH